LVERQLGDFDYALKMRNRLIFISYLALLCTLVAFYELYKENVYVVSIVAIVLMFAGLGAWLWSVQPGKDKK
jgi:hypothetical protein